MYRVSLINKINQDGLLLHVTIQEYVKYFTSNEEANMYIAYLIETKNIVGFVPEVEYFEFTENIDITELKKQDALSKLTEEERRILGINIL